MPQTTESEALDPRWGEPHAMHDPWVLAHFQPRETDVLITTAPKAGTTWMQQILHQMRIGGDTNFNSIDEVVPWLERPRSGKSWQQVLEYYDSLPSPRLFKTHCTAEQTPGIGTARIILTLRDPRDCCVSFYHHIMNMTDEARQLAGLEAPQSFEQHVDNWLEFAAWYRNVSSWWPYRENEKVLMLRYADLKKDISGSVDIIALFLGWALTKEHKETVLEYSSFDWMKAHDEKFSQQMQSSSPLFKPSQFIRQGKVGSYKELLTPDLERRIMERARAELETECLTYLGLA